MTIEGQRQSVPSAPDALRTALDAFENPTSMDMHLETVKYVQGKLFPVLEALSVVEQLGEGRSRRQLSYPVQVSLNGKSYWLHVRQSIQPDGETGAVVIEATTYQPDEVRIAYLGAGVTDSRGTEFPQHMVKTGGNYLANARELREIREIADLIADKAPKQAVERGRISLHWMERHAVEGDLKAGFPFNEGKPISSSGRLYEVIDSSGSRRIMLDSDPWKWTDDLHGDITLDNVSIAAWREINPNGVLPEYYAREKYPTLSQHRSPTP